MDKNYSKGEYIKPELNEEGHNIITQKYLKELCSEMGLYETPKLNTKLFLHNKGA